MREDIRTASAVVDGALPKHCGNASAAEVPGVTRQAVVEPRRQVPRGCSREGGVEEKWLAAEEPRAKHGASSSAAGGGGDGMSMGMSMGMSCFMPPSARMLSLTSCCVPSRLSLCHECAAGSVRVAGHPARAHLVRSVDRWVAHVSLRLSLVFRGVHHLGRVARRDRVDRDFDLLVIVAVTANLRGG